MRRLGQISQDKERAAGVRPAGGLQDRPRLAIGLVEPVVAAVSVGLEDTGVPGQMRFRVLTGSVARVIEHGRRRRPAAKWSIIAHVDPTSPDVSLALGQYRNRRVSTVQPLGRKNVRFDALEDRLEHGATGPDLISQGRQTKWHTFPGVALGLAIERLMLAKLLEQDHGEKAGSGPAPRGRVKRRWCLADLLAVPARELLPHMLDHLPLARDHFQGLGDGLTELAQTIAAAAKAGRRPRNDHPLARQMLGE